MSLESMEPNPAWDAGDHAGAVATLREFADDLLVRVWGGDWCPDCRGQLPDFAAALEAAGVPDERVLEYPVERDDSGEKVGPGMEEYGVAYIPTVVLERVREPADSGDPDTEEVARFVESADDPIAVYLADRLEALEPSP